MIPHRATDARVLFAPVQCGLRHGPQNRALGLMPLFHAVGFYSALVTTLSLNGTYFVHSAFEPSTAVEAIGKHKLTYIFGAPAQFHAMLAAPNFNPADMTSVDTLVYAGAAMPGPLLDRVKPAFPEAAITNIYGTTEVMNALYMPDPVGKPLQYRPGFIRTFVLDVSVAVSTTFVRSVRRENYWLMRQLTRLSLDILTELTRRLRNSWVAGTAPETSYCSGRTAISSFVAEWMI